jgi:hypothetical protein
MALKVASLARTPPPVVGVAEIFLAGRGWSAASETERGGLMGTSTISARARGVTCFASVSSRVFLSKTLQRRSRGAPS